MLNAVHAGAVHPLRPRTGPAAGRPCNAVAAVLTPADILIGLDASTKAQAIDAAARFIAARHGLVDAAVCASLVRREAIGSTGLGSGVAIPHARVPGLAGTLAAFVRTQYAIPFDAPDDKPVSDMLVLLVPQHATEFHLELLAQAAEMFSDPGFRERLRCSVDAAEVHAAFANWQ